MWYTVTATALNLRSKPVVSPSTRIATLPQGQLVREVGPSTAAGWIEVETTVGGATFRGHVSGSYLAPAAPPAPVPPSPVAGNVPPPVHLTPPKAIRGNKSAMAFPLFEPGMPPARDPAAPVAAKLAALHAHIAWLNSPVSVRYQPGGGATYCNIYAYDYSCLSGTYLPRVWWMAKALLEIAAGNVPPVQYGKTVHELSANSLYNWLSEWGDDYGWRRLASPDEAQGASNVGEAVVVCAQRKDLQRSGHITAVAPEPGAPGGVTAVRSGGVVSKPLLSQAGARNFMYEPNNFYLGTQFQAFGFWAHA